MPKTKLKIQKYLPIYLPKIISLPKVCFANSNQKYTPSEYFDHVILSNNCPKLKCQSNTAVPKDTGRAASTGRGREVVVEGRGGRLGTGTVLGRAGRWELGTGRGWVPGRVVGTGTGRAAGTGTDLGTVMDSKAACRWWPARRRGALVFRCRWMVD